MEAYGANPDPVGGTSPDGTCRHTEFDRLALEIGKLPVMRIVEIGEIHLHEEPDLDRTESIARHIEEEDCLTNPLIAARDNGAAPIILDGINRCEALRTLGARFVLIQEVGLDDDGLALSTWHHVVEGIDFDEVIRSLSSVTRVAPFEGTFTDHDDFIPRFDEDWACCIVLPDRRCFAVHAGTTAQERLEAVRKVARRISVAPNRDRVSYTNMNDLTKHYPRFAALVCYRGFSKEDVRHFSVNGIKFPSGVTRFSVPKRALSFRMPLELLTGDGTLEEKQAGLHQIIISKIAARKIRSYEEPTFHFDE